MERLITVQLCQRGRITPTAVKLSRLSNNQSIAREAGWLKLLLKFQRMKHNKKNEKAKPSLYIDIQDFSNRIEAFKDNNNRNQVITKPQRSAKNIHEMKKFNFDEEQIEQCNTARQLRKLKKLEEQRTNLMNSLEILKVSACSAIAQKEEQIQKMRSSNCIEEEEDLDFYESELERSKRIRMELEEEREQLHREMCSEREKYIQQLEEKEYFIEQLCDEIQEVRRELEILEEHNNAKTKKIRLLMEQNSILSDQLEQSSIATVLRDKAEEAINLQDTVKAQSVMSACSSVYNRSYVSYVDSEHHFQSEADKSYLIEKLQDVEKVHRDELLDLKGFYQKRIAALREIYESQFHLKTQQSEKSLVRSRKGSQSSTPGLIKSQSKKQFDSNLNLNLKDMYAIQEGVQHELQTSRTNMLNLKSEIRMQNLSDCPSIEPRMYTLTNDDAESQFTTKYFDLPNRFMKRNRSTDTVTVLPDTKTICKISKKETIDQSIDVATEDSLLKKGCIFAAGVLSGVAVTSLIRLLIKKDIK